MGRFFGSEKGQPVYNTPITPRENMRRFAFHDSPVWIPAGNDGVDNQPAFIPDVKVRGQVKDTVAYDPVKDAGGLDMFGVEWVYVPQISGSMVRPGSPKLEDVECWSDVIKVPRPFCLGLGGGVRASCSLLHHNAPEQDHHLHGIF